MICQMSQASTLFMVTLREFGSVGESHVSLELTLDSRFKPSNIDVVIEEQHQKGFRKHQNPLVMSSLARSETDTTLILCSLRSLGWTLVTSNAFVANSDEFHRMFYFEQMLVLDRNTLKQADPLLVAASSTASTTNATASGSGSGGESLAHSMDQRKQHAMKPKPMSVFKQLAAKRMTATHATPDSTSTTAGGAAIATPTAGTVVEEDGDTKDDEEDSLVDLPPPASKIASTPPVTGAGANKKPGRLSVMQLNMGSNFNPQMLGGGKPGATAAGESAAAATVS
jgi:hypothetical protein